MKPDPTPTSEPDQLVALTPHFHYAALELREWIERSELEILKLAAKRLQAGRAMYGHSLFHKPLPDIEQDVLEEIADAIVYIAEIQRRRSMFP